MASDGTTLSGVTTGVDLRSTHQLLTTDQQIQAKIAWAAFNKQSFFGAMGIESFGVEAVKNLDAFGSAMGKSTGMISFDSGHSMAFPINATSGTSFYTQRNSSYNPEYVEGGDQSLWAWHRINTARVIPEMDVMDNESKALINIKAMRFEEAKNSHVRDMALGILGNTSSPGTGVDDPLAVHSDLSSLISAEQDTRTVGGIADTNEFWKNGVKAITSAGGGGEMDRPILLRRGVLDQMNDQSVFAESAGRYLLLSNQGFWQTFDRLSYADLHENGGVMIKNGAYDAAGIRHFMFNNSPLMWDQYAVLPRDGTASTDFCYGIDVNSFKVSFHTSCNFQLFNGWEDPRVHDQYRGHQLLISTRYTPYVTSRRTHFAIHGVPANAD